jgi:hypothetical protein
VFDCGTTMMMPLTSLPPAAKRWAAADMGGSAVTLTNIFTRSRLSAGAGLVIGFALARVWCELAEAPEPFEVKEASRTAANMGEAAEPFQASRWQKCGQALEPEVPTVARRRMGLPPPNV